MVFIITKTIRTSCSFFCKLRKNTRTYDIITTTYKCGDKMKVQAIRKALLEQRRINMKGNLYYKTQLDFAYNTNHLEGSTISSSETESIYETGTILADKEKVIVLKDVTETKNHFTLFKYMLDTLEDTLTEDMIKKFHFILKNETLTEEEQKWFQVGEYKTLANIVGNLETTAPEQVEGAMKSLLSWYHTLTIKSLEDIIEFHVRFEKIHPFQDENDALVQNTTYLHKYLQNKDFTNLGRSFILQ